jgi:hypothetical protein
MDLLIEKEDVWVAAIDDRPGGLAGKLSPLADAGADLDFIIARRAPEKPGTGVVFVTPIRGDRETRAATAAGFSVSSHMHALRVEGADVPGIAARVARRLADAGLNLRGLSAAVIGTRVVMHLAFDAEQDAMKARTVLTGA